MNLKTFYTRKTIGFIVVLVLVLLSALLYKKYQVVVVNQTPPTQVVVTAPAPISITKKDITEDNFSGSMPVIVGDSALAVNAQAYVNERIAEFRAQANKDVPDIRAKFGADTSSAQYTIDVDAKDVKGDKTESVVISMYAYTGGANGNSSYKVITASSENGHILTLADVVKTDQQNAFTEFVKSKLNAWRPDGSEGVVVFPDDVSALTFNSLTNWSLDDTNLIIYFDKYAVGPGALGAVAFPLSRIEIKNFLNSEYQ